MAIQKSLIRYPGSKYQMLQLYRIHEFIPKCNHDHPYCELFVGSGVMFFNLNQPYLHAFLNDINGDLVNFWIQVRENQKQFEDRIKYIWCGKSSDWELDSTDDLDRAIIFYLNQYLSTFITKPTKIQKNIEFWAQKLNRSRIYIDKRPFDEEMDYLSKLYTQKNKERPCGINFYEDPPYYGSEKTYKIKSFDHELLAQKNHELDEKGHFILLSYNKCPEILELYSDWNIKEFKYSPNGVRINAAKPRTELLISNKPFQRKASLEAFL